MRHATDPLITLTTDFGTSSPYVAAMKGVILSRCPATRLIDLSHEIGHQNILHAAQFLRDAIPWFSPGTIHLVVIDPGVGTTRLPLCIEINQQRILCPDNGLWTLIQTDTEPAVYHLENNRYQLPIVSNVFHGRDIFAPAAAALAGGIKPEQLGPRLNHWQTISLPNPRIEGSTIHGEVVFIDHFGNLITNIPSSMLPASINKVQIGARTVARHVISYGHVEPNEIVSLISSNGHLEIAQAQGDAAHALVVTVGEPVSVN